MHIHFLQHLPFEDAAGIREWMDLHGHTSSRTAFFEQDTLPEPDSFDWLVILGGFMSVTEEERYDWLAPEKAFIREVIDRGSVVIGICLGAQLIADVLGAPITRNRHREIGWHPVRLTDAGAPSPVFGALPASFEAFHWHGDTFALPTGCVHLAASEACPNQAFSFDDRVFGIQFHLESTREGIESLIEECANELTPGPYVQSPERMRAEYDQLATLRGHMHTLFDTLAALHS